MLLILTKDFIKLTKQS